MMFDSYFATQYKGGFVFFGIPTGTSVAAMEDNQQFTMSGCVATLIEVDKEDDFIWSAMPHLSIQLVTAQIKFSKRGIKVYGGYTCGEEIKMFGAIVETLDRGIHTTNDFTAKCWSTSLTKPFSEWSENATYIEPAAKVNMPHNVLAAVQKYQQYVFYFYLPVNFYRSCKLFCGSQSQQLRFTESVLIVSNEENNQLCLFVTDGSVTFDGHVSSAVVGDDLFILSGDKMSKVEKFTHLVVASAANTDQYTRFSISFDLTVPHANSTLFVVQDTLCVVGGCDDNYEPFSDIYQFDQSTQEWSECGVSSVSRYAASVVTFTDRNQKDVVFIAGGFKGKDMPCSLIEMLKISN